MPNNLAELGYKYVRGPTESPNDYVLSPAFVWKGQDDYNAVAAACVAWVRAALVSMCGLTPLPIKAPGSKPGGAGCALVSPGIKTHRGPILLLVCGSAPGGDAGVWGRALCINDSTHKGAMFEAVERAHTRGWKVVVADPHGDAVAPHRHMHALWAQLAVGPDRQLLVIAHSYGASLVIGMLKAAQVAGEDLTTVRAVALTDGMVWTLRGWEGGKMWEWAYNAHDVEAYETH